MELSKYLTEWIQGVLVFNQYICDIPRVDAVATGATNKRIQVLQWEHPVTLG